MKKQFKHIVCIFLAITLILSCIPMVFSTSAENAAEPGTIIRNGDFETGDLTGWTRGSGSTNYDVVASGDTNSSYALKVSGTAYSGTLRQTIAVEPNTDYNIGFRYKVPDSTVQALVKIADSGWNEIQSFNISSVTNSKWGFYYDGNFNSGVNTSIIIIIQSALSGNDGVYFDNIYIKKKNNLLRYGDFPCSTKLVWEAPNLSDFSSDNACGDYGYSYKLTSSKTEIHQAVTLEANTDYILSFYGKRATDSDLGRVQITNTSGTLIGSNYSYISAVGSWAKKAFKFNSGSNTNIWVQLKREGGTVYFDNISIAKAVSASITVDGGGGSVSASDMTSSGYVELNANLTVTATPGGGYSFTGWYDSGDNLVSTDTVYTFKVTAAVNLTAKFTVAPIYKANIQNPDFETGTGAISGNYGWSSVSDGLTAEITDAEAHSGDQSLHLLYTGSGTYKNAFLSLALNSDRAYKLRFYMKSSSNSTLKLEILHSGKWSGTDGTIFVSSQDISNSADWSVHNISIPANNVSGTVYLHFFSNAPIDAYIDDITVAVENTVSVNTNITGGKGKGYVRFANQYGYSDTAEATYLYGDTVNLYAYSDYTNKLLGWKYSGESEYFSTNANYSFELNGNKNIIAEFGFDGLGDFNSNGAVDPLDLRYMRALLLGNDTPETIADVNADTSVNIKDLVSLKKRVVGVLELLSGNSVSGGSYLKQLSYVSDGTNRVGELIELSTHVNGIDSSVNVFDSDELDLSITLTKGAKSITIPGFYYKGYNTLDNAVLGANGDSEFRFRFTLPEAGEWSFTVTLALDGTNVETVSNKLTAYANSENKGYITTSGKRFAYEDGTLYTPIGQNIAYSTIYNNGARAKDIIDKMENAQNKGANFARVWAYQWSISLQKKGYSPNNLKAGMKDAAQFDELFNATAQLGMTVQLSLFTHQMLKTDGDWGDCCYNSANTDGIIANPQNFFTDATAKKQTKDYLRYMVARYGYSKNLFAWELINEADATSNYNGTDVAAWYTEMTAYLKSIDPYGHMVTSSATGAGATNAAYNSSFDFASLHLYYTSGSFVDDFISSSIAAEANKAKYGDKPVMFGELGYQENSELVVDRERMHRQLWATLMSCGGAGASWCWDTIESNDWYSNYTAVQHFASYIDFNSTSYYNFNNSFLNATNAFGYIGSSKAYLWIYARDPGNYSDKSYTVSGLANGNYLVRWYNTYTGDLIQSGTNVTVTNGTLAITTPAFTNDIAVRVTPVS